MALNNSYLQSALGEGRQPAEREGSTVRSVTKLCPVKITVLLDVTPYNLADRYRHFRVTCCLHIHNKKTEDDSTFLRKASRCLPDYTATQIPE
jgi:hypothetical protein